MAKQPYDLTNPLNSRRESETPASKTLLLPAVRSQPLAKRSSSIQQCPNCGAQLQAPSSVCMECGAYLKNKPQKIRCRQCGRLASDSLVICPHCGRELQSASPRLLTWALPAILILAFLIVILTQWQSNNPLVWMRSGLAAGVAYLLEVSNGLNPQITIETVAVAGAEPSVSTIADNPVASNRTNSLTDSTIVANPGSLTETITSAAPVVPVTPTVATIAQSSPTPIAATAAPTATTAPTPLPTATATSTSPPTATTASPTPTPTNTATLALILLPTATFTPVPPIAPVAAASQPQRIYRVKAGDTPIEIATELGVTVEDLLAVNRLSIDDARRLRVGQELIIPGDNLSAPTATPTVAAVATKATATPVTTVTAASSPIATAKSTLRIDTPQLRSPENKSSLSCRGDNPLIWLATPFTAPTDQYLLHLGFLNGVNADGSENIVWVLEQLRPNNVTSWNLDLALCGLAPQAYGRQWRWYVEVVEFANGSWSPVSPPSATWQFSWN